METITTYCKNFLKKFQSLYNFFKNPRIQETFRKEFPLYTPEMQSFPAGYIASISEVQAHSFSRYHRTVCIQDQQDKKYTGI